MTYELATVQHFPSARPWVHCAMIVAPIEPIKLAEQVADELWPIPPRQSRDQLWPDAAFHNKAMLILLALRGKLPFQKRRVVLRRRRKKKRVDQRPRNEMTTDELTFDGFMLAYLGNRINSGWTPGEALDVLLDMDYVMDGNDFKGNVDRFTNELARIRRKTLAVAPWSDVISAAHKLGWFQRAPPAMSYS